MHDNRHHILGAHALLTSQEPASCASRASHHITPNRSLVTYTLQVAKQRPGSNRDRQVHSAAAYDMIMMSAITIALVSLQCMHAPPLAAPEPLIHMRLVSLCHFVSKQQPRPSLVRPQRRNDASDCFNPLYTNQIMPFGDLQ